MKKGLKQQKSNQISIKCEAKAVFWKEIKIIEQSKKRACKNVALVQMQNWNFLKKHLHSIFIPLVQLKNQPRFQSRLDFWVIIAMYVPFL